MNAKVIATSFLGTRTPRPKAEFPQHRQNITSPKEVLAMLDTVLDLEQRVDAGVPVDTIVVLNGDFPLNKLIKQYDNKPTWNGRIRVFERENVGGSFGAYNFAFQALKDEYEYWLFTEDDIVVGTDGYYLKLIQTLGADEKVGFVALIESVDHPLGEHAHGGVGLAHRDVLSLLPELPHYKGEGWDKDAIIREGEVPFTNKIHRLGYQIHEYCPKKDWDFEKKLCIPFHELPKS